MLELSDAAELGVSVGFEEDLDEMRGRIVSIPGVAAVGQLVGFNTFLPAAAVPGLSSFAFADDPVTVDRPILFDGRLPAAADEVFLNESAASGAGVTVGGRLEVMVASPDFSEFVPETVTVVGVGLLPEDVYADETATSPALVYGQQFAVAHRELAAWGAGFVALAEGTERDQVTDAMLERGLTVSDWDDDRDQAGDAIRPLAVTLGALALLAGTATVVLVGQALRRLVHRTPADELALASMGCTRVTLVCADVSVALTVAVAAAVMAAVVAVAASPLFPQGRARRIPQLRGVDMDHFLLGLGALALVLLLAGVVAAASWRRGRAAVSRPGLAPGLLGCRPAVGAGVRFATARPGSRGTAVGVAVGLGSVVAAVVFTGSLESLVSSPELAGVNWDLIGRDPYSLIDTAAIGDRLEGDPEVERITGLNFADVLIDGVPVPTSVWSAVKGSPWPPLLEGRAPAGPNEVLVGRRTLDELGYTLGDTIPVAFAGEVATLQIDMTVVGTAVSPAVGLPGDDTPRLDEGLLVRQEDIAGRDLEFGSVVLFGLADGADPEQVMGKFPEGLPDDSQVDTEWFNTATPAEVVQSRDAIDLVVGAIAVLLVAMMGTVAHNLFVFVGRRRGDFAVFKALGFTSGQVRTTVLAQSGLVVGAAAVVAVPLGIAAGRWLYEGFATSFGVVASPQTPVLALSLAVIGSVALVQAVSLLPARRARQTTATALRPE